MSSSPDRRLMAPKNLKAIHKAIERVDQKSYQILRKQSRRTRPIQDKIYDKVPEKVIHTLNSAFLLAFNKLFMKGAPLIEQSFDKQRVELEFLGTDFRFRNELQPEDLQALNENARSHIWKNKTFSAAEGTVLGLLGIGIPDVPIFLSTLLRALYLTASSYGYSYDTTCEQVYILRIIRLAMTEDPEVYQMSKAVDALGEGIDQGDIPPLNLEEEIRSTAETLSMAMLVMKFIQTFPVVGVVGGLYNPKTLHRIDRLALLKYERRYLMKKRAEL